LIIAVDYDGTLEVNGKINERLISLLHQQKKRGAIIILWTCRSGERLQQALEKLANAGFMPDLVNRNAPQIIKRFGYDPRKVFADVYIDDKNASFH
jgi:5S rRNA maturation endonuclease (ribonuclease M5)